MPTIPYLLADGSRCPGVTTILGHRKESGGLVHAAWKLGTEGKDYRVEWRSKADVGTMIHAMVEADINGEDPEKLLDPTVPKRPGSCILTDPDQIERARNGFRAYRGWKFGNRVEITETEMHLVSEEYKVGGTPDAVGRIGDSPELVLYDWKSGRLYPDHLAQCAAYRAIWNECRPGDPISNAHLLRFDATYGAFTHKQVPSHMLDIGFDVFLHLRSVYESDKVLMSMCK